MIHLTAVIEKPTDDNPQWGGWIDDPGHFLFTSQADTEEEVFRGLLHQVVDHSWISGDEKYKEGVEVKITKEYYNPMEENLVA